MTDCVFCAIASGEVSADLVLEHDDFVAFLDLREDIAEATRNGRRLLVYFGQDGCPYCKQLMATNFSQRSIVEKTRQHFVALAVNIWGDREVTWLDGRVMTEKELARVLTLGVAPSSTCLTR